jgi:L,D-transpeptidase ErfK/SrfK
MQRRDLLAGLGAGLAAGWVARPAAAARVSGDIVGAHETVIATAETTFADLALERDLGFVELVAANPGVDAWVPEPGTPIVLPSAHLLPESPRRGIVVNYADQRLYYFPAEGGEVVTCPVGIPSDEDSLRMGVTSITAKRRRPTWTPPQSAHAETPNLPRVVPPGPDNPLGSRALNLGWPAYLLHGTNRPYSIGRRVSQGCIRLHDKDIEALFERVPLGTQVRLVDQPVKLGWSEGGLYVEIHPSIVQAFALQESQRPTPETLDDLRTRVARAAGGRSDRIAWDLVQAAAAERKGVPMRIL